MKLPIATQSPRRNVPWSAAFAAAVIILSGTALLPRSAEPPVSLGRPNPDYDVQSLQRPSKNNHSEDDDR